MVRQVGEHTTAGLAGPAGEINETSRGLPAAGLRTTFSDMVIRGRIALSASLALVLPPLTLVDRASTPEAGAGDAAVWPQLRNQPHPGTEGGARTRLPNDALDRLQLTPFAPAAAVGLRLSWVDTEARAVRSSVAGKNALVILPLSRAPPAIS